MVYPDKYKKNWTWFLASLKNNGDFRCKHKAFFFTLICCFWLLSYLVIKLPGYYVIWRSKNREYRKENNLVDSRQWTVAVGENVKYELWPFTSYEFGVMSYEFFSNLKSETIETNAKYQTFRNSKPETRNTSNYQPFTSYGFGVMSY